MFEVISYILIKRIFIRMSQEERSIVWEVIVSVILKQKVCMYMCPIPNDLRDWATSLYCSKIVDKKEILHTISNTGIYCSSDNGGAAYLLKYIFENSTFSINAVCNSCEDLACC
jgi:hypothetical protein